MTTGYEAFVQTLNLDLVSDDHQYYVSQGKYQKQINGVTDHICIRNAFVCWREIVFRCGPLE